MATASAWCLGVSWNACAAIIIPIHNRMPMPASIGIILKTTSIICKFCTGFVAHMHLLMCTSQDSSIYPCPHPHSLPQAVVEDSHGILLASSPSYHILR